MEPGKMDAISQEQKKGTGYWKNPVGITIDIEQYAQTLCGCRIQWLQQINIDSYISFQQYGNY